MSEIEYETIKEFSAQEPIEPAQGEAVQKEVDGKASKTRKPRTKSGGSTASKADAKNLMAGQLVGAHKILAILAKDETWIIDDKESQALAVAIADVMAQYNIVVNPKVVAWVNLMSVCTAIYGPRAFISYSKHMDRKKREMDEYTKNRELVGG